MISARRRNRLRSGSAFRSLLLAVAMVAAAGLAAWQFIRSKVDNEIRLEIQRRFAAQYANFRVTLRSARLIDGRGVEMQGLWVLDRESRVPLVYVDEIYAACPIDTQQLLSGARPSATHVQIRGLKVWMERDQDGRFMASQLWPPPRFGKRPPPLTIQDSELAFVDRRSGGERTLNARDVNLEIVPEVRSVINDATSQPEPRLEYAIRGTLRADHVRSLRLEAIVLPESHHWAVGGEVTELRLSPQLLASLPVEFDHLVSSLAPVRGRFDARFQLSGTTGETLQIDKYWLGGRLTEGEILDDRLPARLYDVSASVICDNHSLEIGELRARSGESHLTLSLTRSGWEKSSPMSVRVSARQLALDPQFVSVLPEEAQKIWRGYFPDGVVDVDATLHFDGRHWIPEFVAECKDLSFAYRRFPYRLERTRGTITLKNDLLQVRLKASASGHTVNIQGDIHDPDGQPTGQLHVKSEGPIPLNDKLLAAIIDPRAQAVIQDLHPGGMIAVDGTFQRLDPNDPKVTKEVRIELHDCTMKYAGFPYPFAQIRGTVLWNDQGWSFINLSGRNDTGFVECNGSWRPAPGGGNLLSLAFTGADIPLEDELKQALSPNVQRQWNALRPRGTIDHVEVNLGYHSRTKKLSVVVRGEKWKGNNSPEGRSITVHPTWFPYPLYDVTGAVHWDGGQLQIRNVSASHDDMRVRINGDCRFTPQGEWGVYLSDVSADGLRFDEELLASLPTGLGQAVRKLNMQGAVSMSGAVSFAGNSNSPAKPKASWDVVLDIENGSLQCGPRIEHIHGNVRLFGTKTESLFLSHGQLDVDSLIWRDVQLTQVRGPLMIIDSQAIFGTAAERDRTAGPPRFVTAKVFGGDLSVDATIDLRDDMPFRVQARLDRADLARFSQEMGLQVRDIRGRANAAVALTGNRHGSHTWRGDGFLRLYEADIYQLPVMLSLLKLLRISEPDTTAFTSSDIDFRLQGETIYLDRINFNGDLISLKGHGEMDLARRINLRFYTLVGQQEFSWPIVQAMLQQASQQILLINVTGTLDQPHMTREALPALKETLDQLFPELTGADRLRRLPPPLNGYQQEGRMGVFP